MRILALPLLAASCLILGLSPVPSATAGAAVPSASGPRPTQDGSTTIDIAGRAVRVHVDLTLNLLPPFGGDSKPLSALVTLVTADPRGLPPDLTARLIRVVDRRATWREPLHQVFLATNVIGDARTYLAQDVSIGIAVNDIARTTVDLQFGRRSIQVSVPVQVGAVR